MYYYYIEVEDIAFSHPADQRCTDTVSFVCSPVVIMVLGCVVWFANSLLLGEMHVHAWNQAVLKTNVQ